MKRSIELVTWSLVALTGSTGPAVVLDKFPEIRPGELATDESQSLVNAIVAGENVVVTVSEYPEVEIGLIRNIDLAIVKEKSVGILRPTSQKWL